MADAAESLLADNSDANVTPPDVAATSASSPFRGAPLQQYQWRPGKSGNPLGKVGKFASRAREITRQGRDLLEFWHRVMRNEDVDADGNVVAANWRMRDRLEASARLAERAYGRAIMPIAIDSPSASGDGLAGLLSLLTDAELAAIRSNPSPATVAVLLAAAESRQSAAIDVTAESAPDYARTSNNEPEKS